MLKKTIVMMMYSTIIPLTTFHIVQHLKFCIVQHHHIIVKQLKEQHKNDLSQSETTLRHKDTGAKLLGCRLDEFIQVHVGEFR